MFGCVLDVVVVWCLLLFILLSTLLIAVVFRVWCLCWLKRHRFAGWLFWL